MQDNYPDVPLRWIVIDIWGGNEQQCGVFELGAGLTEPMLMYGGRESGVARSFDADIEHYFVVDGDGIIRFERNRADGAGDGLPVWQEALIRETIDAALALPTSARTWDDVKALFR